MPMFKWVCVPHKKNNNKSIAHGRFSFFRNQACDPVLQLYGATAAPFGLLFSK